jgi:hypothetical protein
MAKSTIGGVSTKQLASEVMKARYIHGDEWQDYIADKFEEAGIQPEFFTINDEFSDREADYQYEKNWIEAKTFINSAEVTKIVTLFNVLKTMDIRMVIMCEWNKGDKAYAKNVKDLVSRGIYVLEGQSECESFIINESVILNPDKVVKMAEPKAIPFDRIIPHPNNRDLNIKNIPTIKGSILKNGFFTQLNVVPVGPETKIKMWEEKVKLPIGITEEQWFSEDFYMIFEGHTRYYSLKELSEKKYVIPDIACTNVPWVTSDDIDLLHKILITTNTTYAGWKLKNYVSSHKGNLELLSDLDGVYSYGKILHAMNLAKKQKWGEANPVYLFCHTDSLDFDDMKQIKNGTYRITEIEYLEQIKPLLDFMTDLTNNNRNFSGTVMRDIIVDIRILYNTNQAIKDRYHQFLSWLKMKFTNEYTNDRFPDTKETGQAFWKGIKNEYDYLINNNMAPIVPYTPPKTINSFI